jgi:hypothetical protein
MNRTFTAIVAQSAVAAAVLVAAPFAFADTVSETALFKPTIGAAVRAQVQAEAIAARDAALRMPVGVETRLDPTAMAFASTVSRAQVHAEAVEAARLGLTGSYDGKAKGTAEQWAQVQRAGQRADGAKMAAAVLR